MRTVLKENVHNLAVLDVMSALVEHRTIFIDGVIDEESSSDIIAQMLYLDSINNKEFINVYIKTPGGVITDGLAIYDISKLVKSPIRTIGMGCVASMGAVLMFMAKYENRACLKHTRFMLHQPSGGAIGTEREMSITVNEVKKLKLDLYKIIEDNTTIPDPEYTLRDDYWLSAEEALNYNIVSKVL